MKISLKITLIVAMLAMSSIISRKFKLRTKGFCNYESVSCPNGETCCYKNGHLPGAKIFQCRHACEGTLQWSHHYLANVKITGGARCRVTRLRSDSFGEEEYQCLVGETFDTK
jgi:hypothetical protein